MVGLGNMMPGSWMLYFGWFGVPIIFVVLSIYLAGRTGVRYGLRILSPGNTAANFLRFSLSVLALIAFIEVLYLLRTSPDQLSDITWFHIDTSRLLSAAVLRSLIGSPIGEEMLFRGWLFTLLSKRVSTRFRAWHFDIAHANILTSVAFTIVHLSNGFSLGNLLIFLAVFLYSLLLGAAREASGGLLLPMWCHFLFNFF